VEHDETAANLSKMSTIWTLVFQSVTGTPDQVSQSLNALMCRYAGAVHRYLLEALKDPEAAAELDQEFALRFLRSDFRHGDPTRGRFRDYVKRVLQNLMKDYYRRKRPVASLDSGITALAVEDEGLAQLDHQFLQSWRNDLLDRSWNAVKELEHKTGQPYYTVLRIRVDHPDLKSSEWADRLAEALGRPISPGAFRQALQRARRVYADHLIGEVADSLDDLRPQALEEELADLELLEYCRPYLKRRG